MKKNQILAIAGVAALGVVAMAGGGWYVFLRKADPMTRGEQLAQAGDLRGAQIEFRNAVRANPQNPSAHLKLAQIQMVLNDPVAAEKEFKAARDLGADRWAVLPQLSQAYMAQGRFKDVLIELPPEGPTPEVAAKNLMLRSMAQVAANDVPAATASLSEAERVAPGNNEVLLTAARLALAARDPAMAETKVDQALAKEPNLVEALLLKGQVLIARGDPQGALLQADKAVTSSPASAPARLDRANQLIGLGEDKRAQADVDAVFATQPRNAGATYLNAVLMVRAGRYADAGAELQKLGATAPRFPRSLYFQALAAANQGQNEMALEFANRYVNRAPSDADGIRLLARTEMAATRPERAITVLTKAIGNGMNDVQTLDLLGRAYAAAGRPSEAVQSFQKALAAAPDDPQVLAHLASSQMQQGDSASAAKSLERSVQLQPEQSNAGEALVAAALSAGDLDKAEAALQRLRAQAGDTETVGVLAGMVRLGRLDLDGGRAAFADTLRRFPDSATAKLNLAKVLLLQGRRAEGEVLLGEILAKDRANLQAMNTLLQMQISGGKFSDAIQIVEAARAAAPTNKALTATLADIIVRSGDARRAVAMLLALKNAGDTTPVILGALGRAQAAAGLTEDAKTTYREILTATPNDLNARQAQVELLLRNKETDAARASLTEALVTSSGNIGIMSSLVSLETQTKGLDAGLKLADDLRKTPGNLPNSVVLKGDLLMQAKRYNDAAAAFGEEYKLQRTGPLAIRLANAETTAGRDPAASKVLQEWLAQEPGDIDAMQLLSLLDIKAKRYPEAEKSLMAVLQTRPGDTVALNNMAWLLQLRNDPRARQMAQRAYLQAPTAETADTLGWIMAKSGDAKAAVPLLQQAATQRAEDMSVQYHLAYALNEAGQKDDAVKILQRAVAAGDFDEKADARKLLDGLQKK